MRLRAGGEVTPDSARHMGLFVVGRLADRHGIRVRLRGSSLEDARSGTTAEVYLPSTRAGRAPTRARWRHLRRHRPAAFAAPPEPPVAAPDDAADHGVACRHQRAQRLALDRVLDQPAAPAQARKQRHHRRPDRPTGSRRATGPAPQETQEPVPELLRHNRFRTHRRSSARGPIQQREPPATRSRAIRAGTGGATRARGSTTSGPPKRPRRRPSRPRTI